MKPMNSTNELLEWGRSDVLPRFEFDIDSQGFIDDAKEDLRVSYPDSTHATPPFSSLMNLSPYIYYDFMSRVKSDDDVPMPKEEDFYLGMLDALEPLMLAGSEFKGEDVAVSGLVVFGKNDVLAMTIEEPRPITKIRNTAKLALLYYLVEGHGLNNEHKEEMGEVPAFDWLLREDTTIAPDVHVPLISLPDSFVGPHYVKDIPKTLRISGVTIDPVA